VLFIFALVITPMLTLFVEYVYISNITYHLSQHRNRGSSVELLGDSSALRCSSSISCMNDNEYQPELGICIAYSSRVIRTVVEYFS